jgi:hypothetical protein
MQACNDGSRDIVHMFGRQQDVAYMRRNDLNQTMRLSGLGRESIFRTTAKTPSTFENTKCTSSSCQ